MILVLLGVPMMYHEERRFEILHFTLQACLFLLGNLNATSHAVQY